MLISKFRVEDNNISAGKIAELAALTKKLEQFFDFPTVESGLIPVAFVGAATLERTLARNPTQGVNENAPAISDDIT